MAFRLVAQGVQVLPAVQVVMPGRKLHGGGRAIGLTRPSELRELHQQLPGGVYIALFYLRQPQRIRVGRLGVVAFEPGVYAYVGSAQRNLKARLDRHARHHKPLRWHIDYLSTQAEMIGALIFAGGKQWECRLAQAPQTLEPIQCRDSGARIAGAGRTCFSLGPPTVASQ